VANGFSGRAATTTDVDTGNLSSDCPPDHPARDRIVFRYCIRIGATVYLPTNCVSPRRTPHRVCFPDLQITRCSDGLVCCEMYHFLFLCICISVSVSLSFQYCPATHRHSRREQIFCHLVLRTIYNIIYTRYCLQNPSTIETFQ